MLPVASPDSPATLLLSGLNDSRQTADGMQVIASFSEDMECSAPGWRTARGFLEKTKSVVFIDNNKVFTNTFRALPELNFKRVGGWRNSSTNPAIVLFVETPGMQRETIAFKMLCPVVTNPRDTNNKPALVLPKTTYQYIP